ncbi:MAG: MoxR family ATPase [Candidatus Thioglobus sp.]|nr:MoxR family ATPase [Candidatus Thioglobus sp.]
MQPIQNLSNYLNCEVLGQEKLINTMLISLLCDGHLLVEGPPGVAKTRAIKALSDGIEASLGRVQFTPDLLPSDLTGAQIYKAQNSEFEFIKGPLFNNFILADEINRSPAKVQSALLEAMAEKQITVSGQTHKLEQMFLVMATQNPIEQEGTYELSEAQLDRFLLHTEVGYPSIKTETKILQLLRDEAGITPSIPKQLKPKDLLAARAEVAKVHMDEQVELYLLNIVQATRFGEKYDKKLADLFEYGASTRASIALDKTARAYAYLQNRDFVSPDDVRAMAFDVLRHRIILTFDAQTRGISKNAAIATLLSSVGSV